jgi:hypothetical protein
MTAERCDNSANAGFYPRSPTPWKITGWVPVAACATTRLIFGHRGMQTLTLIHSDRFPIAPYADALRRESISPRTAVSLDSVAATDASSLRVVLVDPTFRDNGTRFRAADSSGRSPRQG